MNTHTLGFYLRIYRKILVQDLKSKMSYRADFIISTVGMIFTVIAHLFCHPEVNVFCQWQAL